MLEQNVRHHYAKTYTIRPEPAFKQLEEKTHRTSFYAEIITNITKMKTKRNTYNRDNEQKINPPKKSGLSQVLTKGKELSASYNTHIVLLIYTVKSGQSLGSDIGKKKNERSHFKLRYGYYETVNQIVMVTLQFL